MRRKIAKLQRARDKADKAKPAAAAQPKPAVTVDTDDDVPAPRQTTGGPQPKPKPARALLSAAAPVAPVAPQPPSGSSKRKRDPAPDSDSDHSSFGVLKSPPLRQRKATKVPFTSDDETALVRMLVIQRRSYDSTTKKCTSKMAHVFDQLEKKYPVRVSRPSACVRARH